MFSIEYAELDDKERWFTFDEHLPVSEYEPKIRDRRCYLLLNDGELVGVIRYNLIFDFVPFLTLIVLDGPHRKKGYGTLAMRRWEDDMRSLGHKMIMVSTQVDEDAQHFYRKLGYRDMGSIVIDIPPYAQPLEMFLGKAL